MKEDKCCFECFSAFDTSKNLASSYTVAFQCMVRIAVTKLHTLWNFSFKYCFLWSSSQYDACARVEAFPQTFCICSERAILSFGPKPRYCRYRYHTFRLNSQLPLAKVARNPGYRGFSHPVYRCNPYKGHTKLYKRSHLRRQSIFFLDRNPEICAACKVTSSWKACRKPESESPGSGN